MNPLQRARLGRRLRVGGALALLAAMIALAGPRQVLAALATADPGWVLLGLACAVAANLLAAVRWRALCRWLGLPVPLRWAVATYFQGVAVNAVLPGAVVGGDMLRAYGLQKRGHPGVESGLTVLLDRLSGLWMLVVLGAACLAWGGRNGGGLASAAAGRWWPGLEGLPVAGAALSLAIVSVLLPLVLLAVLLRPGPAEGASRLARLRQAMRGHGVAGPYALQAGLSLAVQALSVGALACAARSLGVGLPAWAIAAAAVPIFVMATLPVTFGGWGTREAAAAVALGAFGADASLAVTASVIYGAYALVQALGGAAGLGRRVPGRTDPAP